MPIRDHFCEVAIGEHIRDLVRLNVPVDLSSETSLYSGRLFQIDSDGKATEGVTTPSNPVYIAHRGVECPDVRGQAAISSGLTGGALADASGNGVISGIMVKPGLVVLTTEYHNTGSYSSMDPITGVTGNGKFKESGADDDDETIGYVLAEGTDVNDAYTSNSSRKLIKIQFTKSGYAL